MRCWLRSLACFLAATPLLAVLQCGDADFSGEAPLDGSSDGTSPLDAFGRDAPSADGGVADGNADASTVSPCVGAEHWFCDSFDRDGAIAEVPYWTSLAVTGDASLAMIAPDGSSPPSPPNALVSMAGPLSKAVAFDSQSIAARGLHCELDFRIDERAGDFTADFFLMSLSNATMSYQLVATAATAVGGDGFDESGQQPDGAVFAPPYESHPFANAVWHHLVVEVSLAAGGNVSVFLDGSNTKFVSTVDTTQFSAPMNVSVQVGEATRGGTTGSWNMAYDNVFCDLVP